MLLNYGHDSEVPAKSPGHGIHHAMFGVILKEKADQVGAKVYLRYGDNQPEVERGEFIHMLLIEDKGH